MIQTPHFSFDKRAYFAEIESFTFDDIFVPVDEEEDLSFKQDKDEKMALLGVFSYIGIRGARKVPPQHTPAVGVIAHVGSVGALWYQGKKIVNFDIPDIGSERCTRDIVEVYKVFGQDIFATNNSDFSTYAMCGDREAIIGARPKLDGSQGMVFKIHLEDKSVFTFFWDDLDITSEDNDVEVKMVEKMEEGYYALQNDDTDILRDKEVFPHEMEFLSEELIDYVQDSCYHDGIMLLVDAVECKVPKQKLSTLYYRGLGEALSSDHMVYRVAEMPVRKGFYDYDEKGKLERARPDKLNADSSSAVDIIRNKMLVLNDLRPYVVKRTREVNMKIKFNCSDRRSSLYKSLELRSNRRKLPERHRAGLKKILGQKLAPKEMLRLWDTSHSSWIYRSGKPFVKYRGEEARKFALPGWKFSSEWFPDSQRFRLSFNPGYYFLSREGNEAYGVRDTPEEVASNKG